MRARVLLFIGQATDSGSDYRAGLDLGNLISVLNRSGNAQKSADPFSILTAATGGSQLRFRKQSELESEIATIGVELRSAYLISYTAVQVKPVTTPSGSRSPLPARGPCPVPAIG